MPYSDIVAKLKNNTYTIDVLFNHLYTMATETNSNASKPKEAKRVFTLADIKSNKENALLSAVACIPGISVVIFFVEKNDVFTRYMAAQYSLLCLLYFIVWIPVIGWLIPLFMLIMTIVGAIKAYKGERFDIPVVSKIAVDIVNKF
jgi:uncharacterized membrane protein